MYLHFAGINMLGTLRSLSYGAWFGMDLFFIMSGYLIGTMLLHSFAQGGKGRFLRFYLRRSFRIFPAYYFVLFCLYLSAQASGKTSPALWREVAYLTNYPFTFNYIMPWSWSLAVEEHFYLAVPLLILFLKKFRNPKWALIILVSLLPLALVIRLLIYSRVEYSWDPWIFFGKIYSPTHARFDTLATGVLIAYLFHYFDDLLRKIMLRVWVQRICLFTGFFCLAIIWSPWKLGSELSVFRAEYFEHLFYVGTLTSISYFLLFLWGHYSSGALVDFLGSRYFLYFASLGYGVYLVHIPVIRVVVVPLSSHLNTMNLIPAGLSWLLLLLLTLFVSLVLSYFLHQLIEKPALIFRDRWRWSK